MTHYISKTDEDSGYLVFGDGDDDEIWLRRYDARKYSGIQKSGWYFACIETGDAYAFSDHLDQVPYEASMEDAAEAARTRLHTIFSGLAAKLAKQTP